VLQSSLMKEKRGIPAAREFLELFGEIFHRCALHSVDTQSAALAFYTLFSLTPVLLVVASIAGRFFGDTRVHTEIVRQFQDVMGPDAGLAVAAVLEKSAGPGIGATPGAIAGIVAFVLGVTAVFIQLQEALNRVWEVAPRPGSVFRSLLKKRFVSFALVLAVGFLLLVSLTLSAGLMALTTFLTARIPFPVALISLGNEVLSFLVLSVLIALIYRVLPDAHLEWRDVALGAVVTSILFSVGKWLIGFYLGQTSVASRFGAAGSLVVILLWVYYASCIVLFGAELTAVYSSRYRRLPPRPESGARHAGAPAGQDVT
jgi:membrane protein